MQINTFPSNGKTAQLGFPRQEVAPAANAVRPVPLPKRPKGRWLFGFLLAGIFGFGGYQIWNTFFRYQAFGIVDGRVHQLCFPCDGVVQSVQVREGETVRQGQVLLTVDSIEMHQRQDQLTSDLRTAQATLEAEAARLRWQSSWSVNQSQKAQAEFHESTGKLFREQAQVELLLIELERSRSLIGSRAVNDREIKQLELNLRGQKQNVERLVQSVAEMKRRAELTGMLIGKEGDSKDVLESASADQLKPHLTRIEAILSDLVWLRKRLEQTQVRSPVNGVVVKVQRFTGEYGKLGETLVTILEEGSLQMTLYMPQKTTHTVKVDDEIDLVVEPYPEPVRCKVIRLADHYEPAPKNIERHYSANEKLLPIYVQPCAESSRWMALRVGEVVRLPSTHSGGGK